MMIDEVFNNPESFGRLIAIGITIGIFLYIIILSILQVRQIALFHRKVKTDVDGIVRVATYVYLVIQVTLFVIALRFL